MPSLGPAEILVILVVALLVFGPNKMPEIAKQVGKGFREFRRVQQHLKSELRDVVAEFDAPSASPNVEQQPVPTLPPRDDAPVLPTPDLAEAPTTPYAASPAPASLEPASPKPASPEPTPPAPAPPRPDASAGPADPPGAPT
jgi:sec-independent protein translocase protein TatA